MDPLRSVPPRSGVAGRPVRVLVADDHPLFAKTLEAVLAGDERVEVLGSAPDGKRAIELAEQLEPEVILMDLDMPVLNGFEATRMLRQRGSTARVLVLTASAESGDSDKAFQAGAWGYLTKDRIASELLPAILFVAGEPEGPTLRVASQGS
jgi:two-component system NarL family response regulator